MTFLTKFLSAVAFSVVFAGSALAADAAHKLALHIDQNDPAVMNLVLNNAKNVESYYADKGETVAIEIVAYGPGLKMYTADSHVAGTREPDFRCLRQHTGRNGEEGRRKGGADL